MTDAPLFKVLVELDLDLTLAQVDVMFGSKPLDAAPVVTGRAATGGVEVPRRLVGPR